MTRHATAPISHHIQGPFSLTMHLQSTEEALFIYLFMYFEDFCINTWLLER